MEKIVLYYIVLKCKILFFCVCKNKRSLKIIRLRGASGGRFSQVSHVKGIKLSFLIISSTHQLYCDATNFKFLLCDDY